VEHVSVDFIMPVFGLYASDWTNPRQTFAGRAKFLIS